MSISDISDNDGVLQAGNNSDMDDMTDSEHHSEASECNSKSTSDVHDIDSDDPDVHEPIDAQIIAL